VGASCNGEAAFAAPGGYGDGGNQDSLNALQILQDARPRFDHRYTIEHPGLGTDRASFATRVGHLMRSGVITSSHSDHPAGSAPDPLAEVWAAVTRRGPASGAREWAPAEALPVAEAMKMVTINAASTLGVEDDPQTVPAVKIKDVPVVATILGGRVIPVEETRRPRPLE
jgi:predicted amidohydrolase YtcJ